MTEKLWILKGRTYRGDFNKKTFIQKIRYLIQEQVIGCALSLVHEEIKVTNILDAGCGFGRIIRILCEFFPFARIYGIDISPDQIDEACSEFPRVSFWNSSVTESRYHIPNELTTAVELLMHIGPDEIENAVKYITHSAREFIITVDWWTEDFEDQRLADLAGFCWLHDYEELFGAQGFELVREKKISFVRQKIRTWRKEK